MTVFGDLLGSGGGRSFLRDYRLPPWLYRFERGAWVVKL